MIVPTMSKEEIMKEMLSDFDLVKRKSEYAIKEVKRHLIKTKKYPFVKAYDYVTPKTKNNWIYILEGTKKDIFLTYVNYHYTSIGLMAAMITTDMSITFFTGHFFSRFVERENLQLEMPIDKIKHFFTTNQFFHFEVQGKLDDGASEIIGKTKTGVILGVKTKNKINVCNTYISNEMLKKDQAFIAGYLQGELDNMEAMVKAGLI